MWKDFWQCGHTWQHSAHNTKWRLTGCSIGDFSTIAYFQPTQTPWPTPAIMLPAILNGLISSVTLETVILMRSGFMLKDTFKTALGMSFISMIAMETAMNSTDFALTGGAILTWWVIPTALLAGFITPWPYNYWRLKKLGKACH